jgi:hypothetical protein
MRFEATAEVAQRQGFPLADAIRAIAIVHKLTCLTDDEHIKKLGVKARWICDLAPRLQLDGSL